MPVKRTLKSKRKNQRTILRIKKQTKALENSFVKLARKEFKIINNEAIDDALAIVQADNIDLVQAINLDFSDFQNLLYAYLVENRRLGRTLGMTEGLELKEAYSRVIKLEAADDIKEAADKIIYEQSRKLNNDSLRDLSIFEVVPQAALDYYRNYSVTLSGILEKDILQAVQQTVYNALENGYSVQQTKYELSDIFSNKGLWHVADNFWRMENIARTEMAKGFNNGRIEAFHSEELEGFIVAVQFIGIEDNRTSKICEERQQANNGNGLIFLLGDSRIAENSPPLHFQCRSTWLAVDKYSMEDEGLFKYVDAPIPPGLSKPLPGFSGIPKDVKAKNKIKKPKVEYEWREDEEMEEYDFSFV